MMKQLTPALVAVALVVVVLAVIPVSASTAPKNLTEKEIATYLASEPLVSCELRNFSSHLSATPCYGACPQVYPVYTIGDIVELHGDNTATGTTYLFLTGPGLDEDGAQILKQDPAHWPVRSDNPDTFKQVGVTHDQTWSWTWDTHNLELEDGHYFIYAVAYPYGLDKGRYTPSGRTEITIKNPNGTATATQTTTTVTRTVTGTPQPTETVMPGVVTIIASRGQDYELGEEINFTGTNTAGWKTYLFITGPGLAVNGSQIQSTDPAHAPVENGNPATFKQMDVQGDHTWLWRWGTTNTALDAGTYTLYAVANPNDREHLEKVPYGTVSVTIRKPPVSAPSAAPGRTPAESAGNGAFIALIGIGVVSFIVAPRY